MAGREFSTIADPNHREDRAHDVRIGDERVMGHGPPMTVTSCFTNDTIDQVATMANLAWYDTTNALKTWSIPAQTLFRATRAVIPPLTWKWSECGTGRNREGTASCNGVLVARITTIDRTIDHGHSVFTVAEQHEDDEGDCLQFLDEFDFFLEARESADAFLFKHRHLLPTRRPAELAPEPRHTEEVDETPANV